MQRKEGVAQEITGGWWWWWGGGDAGGERVTQLLPLFRWVWFVVGLGFFERGTPCANEMPTGFVT